MEPISAIASFIAIGQALAATPKIINVLKSLVKARQEVYQLLDDVEMLNEFGIIIRETIENLPDDDSRARFRIPQSTLLRRVETDLASIVLQLKDLAQQCQQGTRENGQINVSKVKWFRYKSRITSLSQKAKKACDDIQRILTCASLFASASSGKMILDIHTITMTQVYPGALLTPLHLQNQRRLIGEITSQVANNDDYEAEDYIDTGASSANAITVHSNTRQEKDSLQRPQNEGATQNYGPLIQVTATPRRACAKDCACQCHSPASRTRPHPAISPIYGWLQYTYNSSPRLGRPACNLRTCQRARTPARINLRFPLLFCSRALEASLSFGSLAGAGASLHLRVTRVVERNKSIWWEIQYGKIERLRQAIARREISPFDHDRTLSYLDFAIWYKQYDIVSMFLDESMSIFRASDHGKRAAVRARYKLRQSGLDERGIYILQRVIALDEEGADDCWPIHEAVRNDGDLITALKQSPDSINALDNLVQTPLHWAVEHGDTNAIQTLISHGANPNIMDVDSSTPLMDAARGGNFECAKALISGGCNVNFQDNEGDSALHFAAQSSEQDSADIVSFLLDHGAQLLSSYDHEGILSRLARYPDAARIEEKFHLLVRAGAELREKDRWGYTPLMRALIRNNTTLLRLLIDAGCRFDEAWAQDNPLIVAAGFGNAECMDILEGNKFAVDVRMRDCNGNTALDIFEWRERNDSSTLPADYQTPNDDDAEAFKRLLQGVRDRYLSAEIQTLETVIKHLKAQNSTLAREHLQSIIQEKLHYNIPAEHRTFRAIDVQIKEEMIDAAMESLEEFIEVSRERIGTDPFEDDYCSKYDLEDLGVLAEDTN